tara:strand:- start:1139 stop:2308 length:1170 start_codon:yes stop_codon:yes gene_type:complete
MIDRLKSAQLPFGCEAFADENSSIYMNTFIRKWSDSINDFTFVLVLAGSRTAEIEGISWAGATPEARRHTAIADAELLLNGPLNRQDWPLPELPAGVSPALISYVAKCFLDVNPYVVVSGLEHSPPFSHLLIDKLSLGPANCLSTGKAMSTDRVKTLWRAGFLMGLNLEKPLLLAECVPGGTTTAHAVLSGIGLDVADLISGSVLNPPVALKKKLVDRGLHAACLGENPSPIQLLAAIGDPFQAIAVGLLLGARSAGQPVLLGGGSQMLAVLALALVETAPSLRADFVTEIAIGTTSWLAKEAHYLDNSQSSFIKLMNVVSDYFEVSLLGFASGLRFHESTKKVLRDYELGYVKEGVGAGALTFLAQLKGISSETLVDACELAVDQLEL